MNTLLQPDDPPCCDEEMKNSGAHAGLYADQTIDYALVVQEETG